MNCFINISTIHRGTVVSTVHYLASDDFHCPLFDIMRTHARTHIYINTNIHTHTQTHTHNVQGLYWKVLLFQLSMGTLPYIRT